MPWKQNVIFKSNNKIYNLMISNREIGKNCPNLENEIECILHCPVSRAHYNRDYCCFFCPLLLECIKNKRLLVCERMRRIFDKHKIKFP